MKHNYFILILLIPLAAMFAGCSDPESFKVKGQIEGGADMNVRLTYYADDAVNNLITVARKGQFEAECAAKTPTLVTVSDGNGKTLGVFYAEPGDKINCTLDRNNPFRIRATGNPLTERWCAVADSLGETLLRGSSAEVNAAVENYIASHSGEEVSALLFAQCYDASLSPLRADSVMRSIAPEAQNAVLLDSYVTLSRHFADSTALAPIRELTMRTPDDTAYRYSPSKAELNFIAFTADRYDWRHDSVRLALRRINRNPKVQVLSLSLASDTFIWKRIVKQDSATCTQGWMPGGTLAPQISRLAMPSLPYFIVTDSTGRQLLRTASLSAAENFLRK